MSWVESFFPLAKVALFSTCRARVDLLFPVSSAHCTRQGLMNAGGNEGPKFKPQEILEIVITKGHTDKIICPSKENLFTYVKNRDQLRVLVRKLDSVFTEESKNE